MPLRLYLDEDVSERLLDALDALGDDVTSVGRLRHKGLGDPQQLLVAAELGSALVSYNARDFRLVHDAWHRFARAWNVAATARHAGILLLHPSRGVTVPEIAGAIHRFARSAGQLENRLFAWTQREDWREII